MNAVIIGAGNVGTHLAKVLFGANLSVVQIYNRSIDKAISLASSVGAEPVDSFDNIKDDADFYFFTVKDDVLKDLASKLKTKDDAVWIHTSGSVSIDVFSGFNRKCGVFYPLQTFSISKEINFKEIPLLVEGTDSSVLSLLMQIGENISNKVLEISSQKRAYAHLAAVFCCNFTNNMYAISQDMLKNAGLPFDIVLPLIKETASKVEVLSPLEAQTGPATRDDKNVIDRHLALIADDKIKEIYKLISDNIYNKIKENKKN